MKTALVAVLLSHFSWSVEARVPVVAYLFTMRHERPLLRKPWEAFWNACPPDADVRIHTHADPTTSRRSALNTTLKHGFAGSTIPGSIHIKRFEYTMVQARILLLRHALSVKPAPDYFFFFSETDAPIGRCSDLLSYLEPKMGGSFIHTDSLYTIPGSSVGAALKQGGQAWEKKYAELCPGCK